DPRSGRSYGLSRPPASSADPANDWRSTMARRGRLALLVVALAAGFLSPSSVLADPISMGPQAMEGDLKVSPGDVLMAGYDFTIPGSHPAITVQLVNPAVVFQAQCVSGGDAGTIVVPLASGPIPVPQNS